MSELRRRILMGTSAKGFSCREINAPWTLNTTMLINTYGVSVANDKLFVCNAGSSAYGSQIPLYYTENMETWTGAGSPVNYPARVTVTHDWVTGTYMFSAGSATNYSTNLSSWPNDLGTGSVGGAANIFTDDYWMFLANARTDSSNQGGIVWKAAQNGCTAFSITNNFTIQILKGFYYKGLLFVLGYYPVGSYTTYPVFAVYKNPLYYSNAQLYSNQSYTTIGQIGGFYDGMFFKGQFIFSTNGGHIVTFDWNTKTLGTPVNLGSGGNTTLACSDDVIMACTSGGTVHYSTDGINWTQITDAPAYAYQAIGYYEGTFVLINTSTGDPRNKLVLIS